MTRCYSCELPTRGNAQGTPVCCRYCTANKNSYGVVDLALSKKQSAAWRTSQRKYYKKVAAAVKIRGDMLKTIEPQKLIDLVKMGEGNMKYDHESADD